MFHRFRIGSSDLCKFSSLWIDFEFKLLNLGSVFLSQVLHLFHPSPYLKKLNIILFYTNKYHLDRKKI